MTQDELYKQKGELHLQLEIAQARLQQVNQQLIELMNKPAAQEPTTQAPTVIEADPQ